MAPRITSCGLGLLLLVLSGCVAGEPLAPYDDPDASTEGFARTGARGVASPSSEPDAETPVFRDHAPRWPELPREALARLEVGMDSVAATNLLGEPVRREIVARGVDRPGGAWNAEHWTWRFQDSSLTPLPFTRELELRFERRSRRELGAGRTEDRPGAESLLLVGWDLY